jgi:hypothetical protein
MTNTVAWLWGMVRNPPLVWENLDGTSSHTEQVPRFGNMSRWDLRPHWMHTVLTTGHACGCRKRLGLWRTIYCMDHAGLSLGDDVSHDGPAAS